MGTAKTSEWDSLVEDLEGLESLATHPVTVIIATYNCAHNIGLTLSSIINQSYPETEIVIVDAGSTDRTLPIIKSYESERIRIYSAAEYNLYEMFNRGLALACGRYVCYLVPGDFYISNDALAHVSKLAHFNDFPDLVLGGSLLRYGTQEPLLLNRDYSVEFLQSGKQPTGLQGCWFRRDTLRSIGGFHQSYSLRAGFDVLCRIKLSPSARISRTSRVLTDFDRRPLTYTGIIKHFWDTCRIIYRHFGIWSALRWSIRQGDVARSLRLWLRHMQLAFSRR